MTLQSTTHHCNHFTSNTVPRPRNAR